MITVGGFNTSIDKLIEVDEFAVGHVQRASKVSTYPGGKGLHVATAVAALGEPVALVGLVDKAHRALFADWLGARGVAFHGIELPEEAALRTCVAVRERSGRITEILEPGPPLDAPCAMRLEATFGELARGAKLAVLSGSLPPGLDTRTYARLIASLQGEARAGVRCLVDTGAAPLREAMRAQPFMVKPNRDEAETWLGAPVEDLAAAMRAARRMTEEGVSMVVISLGEDGAVACARGELLHASVEIPAVENAVGSGDALLGGMAVGLARGLSLEAILRLGVACGAANAMTRDTGFFRRADVESLLPLVELRRLG